jgi:hypothetical protein
MALTKGADLLIQSGILAAVVAFAGNLWVTHQANKANLNLEKRKHESELIIQAIDPHNIRKSRKMLKFIVDVGLIEDSSKLKKLLEVPGNLPATRGAVACYAHRDNGSTPAVALIEDLPGRYDGRIFKPMGFEDVNLSESAYFKALCHETHAAECPSETDCWAGGDTGGFYGLKQQSELTGASETPRK